MTFKFEGRGLTVEQPTRIPIIDERTLLPFKAIIEEKEFTAYIEGYSRDSRRARAFDKSWADKRNSVRIGVLSFEEEDRLRIERLAALTVDWCIVTDDGDVIGEKTPDGELKPEPYSEAAGLHFFASQEWVHYRRQYEVGLNSHANFMKRAPKTS